MDQVNWSLVWSILSFLVMGGINWMLWMRKPGEDAKTEIVEMAHELRNLCTLLSDRVSRLEENAKHTPTNRDLERLSGELREVNARCESVVTNQQRQGNQLDRIESYLRDNK